MNYQRVYDQIIDRARKRRLAGYYETHHILPRALGGSDEPTNLVDLTYREHFLVHWLLAKIVTGRGRRAMAYALQCMGTMDISGQRIVASWQYDIARRSLGGRKWRSARRDKWINRPNESRRVRNIDKHEHSRQIKNHLDSLKEVAFKIADQKKPGTAPRWPVIKRGKKIWVPVNLSNVEELARYINGKSRGGRRQRLKDIKGLH